MLFEGGYNPLTEGGFVMAWRHLRGLRARPPGAAATNPERRDTVTTSLEQAEQLFSAAESAGVMTKPLQLYYGLSQAGRAIASVAPMLPDRQQGKPAEPWKLSGHGIAIPGMEQALVTGGGKLGLLPVADKGTGAFTQMAALLGSGSLTADKKQDGSPAAQVTVGEIWRTIPEELGFPLEGALTYPVLGVDDDARVSVADNTGWECGSVEGVPTSVKESGDPGALKEFLLHYPAAGSWVLPSDVTHTDPTEMWLPGHIHESLNVLVLLWPTDPSATKHPVLTGIPARVGARYFNESYLFPALGDNTQPLHPLLAWWAVLYALSMVARYEPRAWTSMTAVNTSEEAVSIEHLLDTAVHRLPRLILDVVDEITS